jgi:hypothetical protein
MVARKTPVGKGASKLKLKKETLRSLDPKNKSGAVKGGAIKRESEGGGCSTFCSVSCVPCLL